MDAAHNRMHFKITFSERYGMMHLGPQEHLLKVQLYCNVDLSEICTYHSYKINLWIIDNRMNKDGWMDMNRVRVQCSMK